MNELQAATNNLPVNNTQRVQQMKNDLALLNTAYKELLIKNIDYGLIPKTEKPTLFKAGAEKLCLLFGLTTKTETKMIPLEKGHREYHSVTTIYRNGVEVATASGSCCTLESKYRYRNVWEGNVKKKIENQDIADVYNTCLKMAEKRSEVGVTMKATNASMIFTQDLEDFYESEIAQPSTQAASNLKDIIGGKASVIKTEEEQTTTEPESEEQPKEEKVKPEITKESIFKTIDNKIKTGKNYGEIMTSLSKLEIDKNLYNIAVSYLDSKFQGENK